MGVFKSVRGSKFTVGLKADDGTCSKVKVFKMSEDADAYAESLQSKPAPKKAVKESN